MENLFRSDYDKLLKWKNKQNHFPLIIRGLRQIGKSYLAEKFAFEQYGEEYCPVLDFRHNGNLDSIFKDANGNKKLEVDSIIQNIKILFPDKQIIKGKTCIVIDEIGDSSLARESLKVFGCDSGYDIIATGSLLGLSNLKGNKDSTPIGYEDYLDMKPLNFIEFLINSGVKQETLDIIFEHIQNNEPVNDVINNVLFAHLHRYLLVGGMPRAVKYFLNTNDLNGTREILVNLRKDFEDDFGKIKNNKGETQIDSTLLVRTLRAYRSIPDQLAKENKKFKYSTIPNGGRSSEFSDALMWLNKTDIITLAHNVRAIETPLEGNAISEEFKVYPTDIGLLLSSYPISIMQEILTGNLGAYKGMIYEGFAADCLYKTGFPLYYYSDTKRHLENDFLIEDANGGIVIIESKATNGKMASSKYLMDPNSIYKVNKVYKVSNSNFGIGNFYVNIPQYALPFLLDEFSRSLNKPIHLENLPNI